MIPSPPFPSFSAAGQGMEMCRGPCSLRGTAQGPRPRKGVRMDSWAPCYGVICGMLVLLLPSILPSVKQAFSLFLPGFLPCMPTAMLFPC